MLNRQPVAVRLSKIIKKSWLKVDLNDDDSCRIRRIGLKKEKNGNKYQQITDKFRNFSEQENGKPR